ncbi:MAG: IS66 family transposase, partial [Candidatus Heimdallarchaeota archaeon]
LKRYGGILYRGISGRYCSLDRRAAEELYESGKEPTVAKLLEYDAENEQLKMRIVQLEKNSTNSSKPPSSDDPQDKNPKTEIENGNNPRKRKAGGQPGHKGNNRDLIPVEEVDDLIHYYPEECENCGKALPQDETANVVGEPFRWQVAEIEPIKPIITEHQGHSTLCKCGCHNSASLPPEVLKSNFGPRLASIIAYLTAVLHVSRRGSREFCETLLNVDIALGSVQNLLEDTSNALDPIDKELKEALPKESVINVDETGWRDRWLWIFVASTFIYFQVAKNRSSKVLVDVLGELYKGILCVDRWGAYTKYHKGLFQICWAHLKRDFLGILTIGQTTQSEDAILFAQTMEKLRKKIMAMWYRFKAGEISRAELIKKTTPAMNAMKRCLKQYLHSEKRFVQNLAGNLFKRFDQLFTFIFYDGVEPTNNMAERGIRPAVQWRKICFGNRTDNGAVLTSRLLTVTRTCWLQKHNPLEFLVDAVSAHRSGKIAPSLL